MYFAITIVIGAFLWFILRKTISKPLEIKGKSILRFSSIFQLLGIVCMAIGLSMPFYPFVRDVLSKEVFVAMFGLFVFFFGMGYWIFSWSRNHQVIYDDNLVTVMSSKTKQKTFQWTDIKDVKLNAWTSKYILTLRSGDTVDVHQYLSGVKDFIKKAGTTV